MIKNTRIKIDLEELEKEKKANFKERLEFIEKFAIYIKKHKDWEWSKQQNIVIDSQVK